MAATSPTTSSHSAFSNEKRESNEEVGGISVLAESVTTTEEVLFTTEEERRVMRKVDIYVLPGLTLLYLLNFLNRTNIAGAKGAGLLPAIGVTDASAYNTTLALYFLGYVLFEIPSNLVLKRGNPAVVLPSLAVTWGIVSICQGFISSEQSLYIARFFLGVSEAGLFCGALFVISLYYKRHERHWRVAILFGGAALAGSFGGILAWALEKMNGVGGKAGWAWIFFLEGALTVVVGLSAYWWIPGYPASAYFLYDREKQILRARLSLDGDSSDKAPFEWGEVGRAFLDPYILGYSFLFHAFAFPLFSLSLFLPTIITQFGYANWQAQLISTPIYLLAFIGIVGVAWASHVTNRRGSWIVVSGFIAIIGYIVLLTTKTAGARYAGTLIAVVGVYMANGLLLSWPAENILNQTRRATGGAMQIFIGDIGAIAGVLVYRPSLSANFFRIPHLISIGYIVFGIIIAASLSFFMGRENQRRELASGVVVHEGEKGEIEEGVGEKSLSYRYQL